MQTKLSAPTAMADTARDITRRRARWPWVAGAVACLAFALLQFFVERRAFSSWVHFPGGSRRFEVDWPTIRYAFAGDLARYLGLSLAGITLVFRGRRKLFWVPAVAYVGAPLLFGWGDHNCELLGRLPAAVGEGWRPFSSGCDSSVAAGWGPAMLELTLVLVPALALAMMIRSGSVASSREATAPVRDKELTAFRVASVAFVGFAVWALLWAWQLAGTRPSPFLPQLAKVLPLVAFGLILASLRPRIAWALPAVAVLLATGWASLLFAGGGFSGTGWSGVASSLPYTAPFLALPVFAAMWEPLSRGLHALVDKPRRALLLLNALNVVDAMFTAFAVRTEGALEANPFVRVIGLPAKILLVGMLSPLVFRARPHALAWLTLILAGVLVWHLAGFWASPR
jgi:hypothetical protein